MLARTYSDSLELGRTATSFELPIANPEVDGKDRRVRSLEDYSGASIVVVVFMCNHCPYVIHVRDQLIGIAKDYADLGVQLVGISSNDATRYPDDSFERMREDALNYRYPFPYLYDESQEVARAYGAV